MFLFEFRHDNKSAYLLGSVHSLSLDFLPREAKKFLLKQTVLITEGEEEKSVSERLQFLSKLNLLNENADSTHDNIDQRILKIAKKALHNKPELNLKLNDLSHEGVIMFAAQEGHKGMDSELAKHYIQERKLVLNLDDANTFQGMDIKYLENYVISSIENPIGSNIMSLAYLERCMLTDMLPSDDDPMLIKQRNTSWITKIENYFEKYNNGVVCCVGTAHLFGEYGLLKLLIERGYLINRIKNDLSKIVFSRDDLNELESSAKDLFTYDENINEWFVNKELDIEVESNSLLNSIILANPFHEFQDNNSIEIDIGIGLLGLN